MPPEIQELLARFQGGEGVEPLTDDELVTLREALEAHAVELAGGDNITPETVQALQDLAVTAEAVDAMRTERNDTAVRLQQEADEAIARIRGHEENRTSADQPEGQPGESEGLSDEQREEREHAQENVDASREQQEAEADEPQASGDHQAEAVRRAARMSAQRPRRAEPRRSERQGGLHATATLTTASRYGQLNPGDPIPSMDMLGEIMARRLQAMGPRAGSVLVASQFTRYPEERQLDDNTNSNERKLDAVTTPQAIVASGGICTPVAVDYSIPTFSVADRPVKAALPGFGAARGGIRYLVPPVLSGGTAGASGIWTHQNDASPSAPTTKPIYRIACASEVQVLVDAVTMRLEVGNMMGRFSPEVVTANTQLALANFARVAELNLLNQILAGSTEVTFAGAGLGATPELLASLDLALAGMRNYNRLSDNVSLRTILPEWIKPLLRSDLARRVPGDGTQSVSDGQLMAWFSDRKVNVSWTLDPVAAQGTGNTNPLQGFGAQATGANLDYPAKLVFPLYPEGTWQFLDGGQLDLGVVRDSTLDATNDYETFAETFEGVAKRGIVSYKVIVPLRPTGTTSGTKDTSAY